MPDTREELFSIAVFPYLKTSGPVRFGPYLFRSTDDLEGLSKAQVTAVTEVTAMLYTQNNARVPAAFAGCSHRCATGEVWRRKPKGLLTGEDRIPVAPRFWFSSLLERTSTV